MLTLAPNDLVSGSAFIEQRSTATDHVLLRSTRPPPPPVAHVNESRWHLVYLPSKSKASRRRSTSCAISPGRHASSTWSRKSCPAIDGRLKRSSGLKIHRRGVAAPGNADFEISPGSFIVQQPLDVMQIDHTPMDIVVVDDPYRQPLGKHYLTLATDVAMSCILGFLISFVPPGAGTVSLCMTLLVSPKAAYLKQLGVVGDWSMAGLPKTLHLDGGRVQEQGNAARLRTIRRRTRLPRAHTPRRPHRAADRHEDEQAQEPAGRHRRLAQGPPLLRPRQACRIDPERAGGLVCTADNAPLPAAR